MSADFLRLLGARIGADPQPQELHHAPPATDEYPRFVLPGDQQIAGLYAIAMLDWHRERLAAAVDGVAFAAPLPSTAALRLDFEGPVIF